MSEKTWNRTEEWEKRNLLPVTVERMECLERLGDAGLLDSGPREQWLRDGGLERLLLECRTTAGRGRSDADAPWLHEFLPPPVQEQSDG